MSYTKRDWNNTGNEVTKEDFKRIENGIESNDLEITKQNNPTIPDTLAYKINDCLKKVDRTNIDLNTIRNTGSQGYATNCTNKPGLFDGTFFDYKTSTSTGYQEYVSYYDGKKYKRYYLSGTWQPWEEIATVEKVETLWTGTASTGTLTLIKKVTNYNQLIFRFTNGFICSLYSWDYPSVFNTGTYMILVPSGSIIMSFANGDITITSNTTSINFGMVKGVKRGDVNA